MGEKRRKFQIPVKNFSLGINQLDFLINESPEDVMEY